jgi:peptidoglycan/xylan/chitin deacetylase (PgdA/CDA1 family)
MHPGVVARARSCSRRILRRALGLSNGPVIFMYHRVAETICDPWGISVPPARFREQLEHLRAHWTILAMDELVAALEAQALPRHVAALTFDDGYTDNALVAKPILKDYGIPATMFLTTGSLGSSIPYWWDELATLVLERPEAAHIDCEAGGIRLKAQWESQKSPLLELRAWRVGRMPPPGLRAQAYLALWTALQRLQSAQREEAMTALRERLCPAPASSPESLPMSVAQARALASAEIALGGHARSHAPLPVLSEPERRAEIEGCRADLLDLCGANGAPGFAYPHGEWDAATRAIVMDAGFAWAVTTGGAPVNPRRFDRYALPRIQVDDFATDLSAYR